MTFVFDKRVQVVKEHVRAKCHQSKCGSS